MVYRSAGDGGLWVTGVSIVGTALLVLLVPPTAMEMAVVSCALVTSPGSPCAPSAPCGMPKVKCTFVPSKLTLTVAALPAGSVFTASTMALAKGGPCTPASPCTPCTPASPRGMAKVRGKTVPMMEVAKAALRCSTPQVLHRAPLIMCGYTTTQAALFHPPLLHSAFALPHPALILRSRLSAAHQLSAAAKVPL